MKKSSQLFSLSRFSTFNFSDLIHSLTRFFLKKHFCQSSAWLFFQFSFLFFSFCLPLLYSAPKTDKKPTNKLYIFVVVVQLKRQRRSLHVHFHFLVLLIIIFCCCQLTTLTSHSHTFPPHISILNSNMIFIDSGIFWCWYYFLSFLKKILLVHFLVDPFFNTTKQKNTWQLLKSQFQSYFKNDKPLLLNFTCCYPPAIITHFIHLFFKCFSIFNKKKLTKIKNTKKLLFNCLLL